jgi:hypothetical protein
MGEGFAGSEVGSRPDDAGGLHWKLTTLSMIVNAKKWCSATRVTSGAETALLPSAPMAKMPPEVMKYLQDTGREYGRKGGEVRASRLTPEQRSEIAKKAARARWAKRKKR